MNDKELTIEIIKAGEDADDGYFQYAYIVARRLPKNLHESLGQLVNGPVYDGDVISKALRGELFDYGLAIRVCFKGQQGYTGATYFAYSVMKTANEIKAGKIG